MTVAGNAIIFMTIDRATRDERMLIEHAGELERSREQYRSLVENIDQGITLIDRNFNIVTINASQTHMFDRSPDYFIGKKCYREFEKRDAPCAHCPGARAMVTRRPCVTETAAVLDDGSTIPVLLHAFPLRFDERTQQTKEISDYPVFDEDGRVVLVAEYVRDITDRHKAEHELKEYALALEIANQELTQLSLTAHAMPQDIRLCAAMGCDFHLSKPIDRQLLIATIARFLASAASIREKCPADVTRE